jgi:hypothetical protein
MKKAILLLIPMILIGVIFFSEMSWASQDPNDPYGPDSVLFRSKQLLVPCPPEGGQAVLPLYFRNDTPILGLQIPLNWSGAAVLDSASFFGSRIGYVANKQVTIDNLNKKVLVTAQVGYQQSIPEGRGMLVKFYFSTTDTGELIIDTAGTDPEHLLFTREDGVTYTPQYWPGVFHLTCTHDPNDPGAPDSVSFSQALTYYPIPGGPYAYYPLPSGPGKVFAHIRVSNSDSVGAMFIPLTVSGPMDDLDSITFRESIFGDSLWIIQGDSVDHRGLIALIPVNDPPIPPSTGLFLTLCFTLTDNTGLVVFDTTFIPPMNHLLFTTTEPQGYCPQYIPGEFPVIKYWPGDVTFDGELVDVADIVFLLNFIYKNGPYPPHPVSADVNGPDGLIDIQDVVYMINYLFKHGPSPLPGDPW